MSRGRKAWYSIFFLLLWIQLIFAAGLTVWRYQLIIFRDGELYLGNPSPGVNGFINFVEQNCPEELPVGYMSDQYKSGGYARYALYPRIVQPLPSSWRLPAGWHTGEQLIPGAPPGSAPGGCLMIEYMAELPALPGQWLAYNADQVLVVVP